MSERRIIAVFHTVDFRGDHAADVTTLNEVREGETVEELANRLFNKRHHAPEEYERIELRTVRYLAEVEERMSDG